MAAKTFEEAMRRVLLHEGGYTNHPSDPGGPTNWGITIFDARKYAAEFSWIKENRQITAADVEAMPLWFAKAVYRAKYWDAQRLDELEPGPDYAMFDYGINSGIGRSGKVLRRVLAMNDSSYVVDDALIAKANSVSAAKLVGLICDERLRFLMALRTWPVFGRGWGRRVAEVKDYGLAIAQDLKMVGSPPLQPAQGLGVDPDEFEIVREMQQALVDKPGLYDGAIDGDIGPRTIKALQRAAGFVGRDVDGVVGPKTAPALERAMADAKSRLKKKSKVPTEG